MRAFATALAALLMGCSNRAPHALPVPSLSVADPISVGVVWWPADPATGTNALASDVEACLARRIADAAPEIAVVSQRNVRDALYPLLEPVTQPADEAEFGAFLARDDVRSRLAARGMRYLVAFAGDTKADEFRGFVLCGAGYGGGACLGFAWRGEDTALDAALWSLDEAVAVRRERAHAKGQSLVPALVLPIPIPAATRAEACRELGTRLAAAIRETEADRRSRAQ